MPFEKDDGRLLEMGLEMLSKVDADFIRSLFVGIHVPAV